MGAFKLFYPLEKNGFLYCRYLSKKVSRINKKKTEQSSARCHRARRMESWIRPTDGLAHAGSCDVGQVAGCE